MNVQRRRKPAGELGWASAPLVAVETTQDAIPEEGFQAPLFVAVGRQ